MICSDIIIRGRYVDIGESTAIHPRVTIISGESKSKLGNVTIIGEGNVIEELAFIEDCRIGDENLIEIGTIITSSTIGNGNFIGPKCNLLNCAIGNHCNIAPAIHLEGVIIPDNSSIYAVDGKWQTRTVDVKFMDPTRAAYLDKLANNSAPQSLSKNFTPHIRKLRSESAESSAAKLPPRGRDRVLRRISSSDATSDNSTSNTISS